MGEAGWFNDESDPALARWHDGERWTEHTVVKADWAGPDAPPPPPAPAPPAWVPGNRPPDVAPHPRSAKDRYLGWPRWARIAAPAAAGLLAISALGSLAGDDEGDGRVDTSEAASAGDALPSIDEATASALEDLDVDVSHARLVGLVRELCDGSPRNAARALATITQDADDQRDVLHAAGGAAEDACPETTRAEPQLLNDVYAAVAPTTTTVDASELAVAPPSTAPPTTAAPAPKATTATTKAAAPAPTQPPAPQPVAPQPSGQCHPSYVGACLDPSSPDYDCAGGRGNGPHYTGPVQVVGSDPFDLDSDGDGYACEG